MDVIKTGTAVADKFGAGLNGFRSADPGPPPELATQFSPEWADSVQMELVYAITSQGIVLDGMVFNQLQQAIDSWAFAGDPSITSGHNLTIESGAMLLAASGGTIETLSGSGLVLGNGSTFAVQANVTLSASDNTWVWGSSDNNDWTINGNVTIGTSDVTQISLVGEVDLGFDGGSTVTSKGMLVCEQDVTVTNSKSITVGKIIVSPAVAPAGARELVADSSGNLIYRPSGTAHFVHHSANGWTYATGEQEADSGLFSTNLSLFTAQRATPQTIDVIIIAEGWGQRNTAGDVQLQLQWDDGAGTYSDQGASVDVAWVSTASATTWSYFRIARRLSPNTAINRLYRLKVVGLGGSTSKIREATIRVVNPQR